MLKLFDNANLADHAMFLLMHVHCENCGHASPDPGYEILCENCSHGPMQQRITEAKECVLAESVESELVKNISEVSKLDYLLKMEKFFDDRDLYLYPGWEDAQILSLKVDKFWVSLDLRVGPKTELKGALRCCSNEENQNTAKYKQLEDGSFFVRFKVLRRILDKIEMAERDRAESITDNESEV